ncbi:MAG TPA: SprT family zinc-dependent metalloprotease [Gammaproteobacteria bacterium]
MHTKNTDTAALRKAAQLPLDFDTAAPPAVSPIEPPVRLRSSARAKHLQIKVSPWAGVEVIVPRRRTSREVEHFLSSHREWIRKAWRRLLQEYPEAGSLRLPERIVIPLLERSWKVRYAAGGRLREDEGVLLVPHDGDVQATALKLQEWMKRKARETLPARMERWCERTGLRPAKIAIRGQATRWGSCSTRNTISLNFRLLFLEKPQIDCLLLHEICHLKHLDHGRRFWALMESHMPGARERDRALGEGWKDVPPWALVK